MWILWQARITYTTIQYALKSVKIWKSYSKKQRGPHFMEHMISVKTTSSCQTAFFLQATVSIIIGLFPVSLAKFQDE